jgi:YVTN family beta-propeller protein
MRRTIGFAAALALCWVAADTRAAERDDRPYWVCVSNEKAGTVTVIEGGSQKVLATIPVGKRPRGVHPSPNALQISITTASRKGLVGCGGWRC